MYDLLPCYYNCTYFDPNISISPCIFTYSPFASCYPGTIVLYFLVNIRYLITVFLSRNHEIIQIFAYFNNLFLVAVNLVPSCHTNLSLKSDIYISFPFRFFHYSLPATCYPGTVMLRPQGRGRCSRSGRTTCTRSSCPVGTRHTATHTRTASSIAANTLTIIRSHTHASLVTTALTQVTRPTT